MPTRSLTFRLLPPAARSLALACGMALSPLALAEDAPQTAPQMVLVTLSTGETLRGELLFKSDDAVQIAHPVLGTITIAASKVVSVNNAAPLPGEPAPGQPAQKDAAPSPAAVTSNDLVITPPAPPPAPEPDVKWSGFAEGGVNGSEGNTEQMSARFGLGVDRAFKKEELLTLRGTWRYKTENGDKTQNEVFLRERNEWFLNPSKWLLYAEANQEYNEFKDYNWRIDFIGGVGYRFIDNDRTRLTGRVGAGIAKEFGGANDDWYPIAVVSLDFTHKITDRISFAAYGEYKPDLSDFENYQLLGRVGLDIALNDSRSLFLKMGIEDRYDNDPGPGTESNDIDYFLLLAYKF